MDSASGHRYFLRSSAKTKSPTAAASVEPPRTPPSKLYKPLELAKMSIEERNRIWEGDIAFIENESSQKVTEGMHLRPFYLALLLIGLGLIIFSSISSRLHRNPPSECFPFA